MLRYPFLSHYYYCHRLHHLFISAASYPFRGPHSQAHPSFTQGPTANEGPDRHRERRRGGPWRGEQEQRSPLNDNCRSVSLRAKMQDSAS